MSRIAIPTPALTALDKASSQSAWACCGMGSIAGIGYAAVPAAFAAGSMNIYQMAYEQAVRATRRSMSGRYIAPSMN